MELEFRLAELPCGVSAGAALQKHTNKFSSVPFNIIQFTNVLDFPACFRCIVRYV